jgi:hypothetical protein
VVEGLRNIWMGVCEGDGNVGSAGWIVLRSEVYARLPWCLNIACGNVATFRIVTRGLV